MLGLFSPDTSPLFKSVQKEEKSQPVCRLYHVFVSAFIWHLIGNQDHACLESPALAWAANKMPDENTLGVFHHVSNCIYVIRIRASHW